MTLTSVMSVTVSPWIPAATREAVRDTTLVHDPAARCVSVYVCVKTTERKTDGVNRPYSFTEARLSLCT